MGTASLFSLSSIPKHSKGTQPGWERNYTCISKSAAVRSFLSQDLHNQTQCEQGRCCCTWKHLPAARFHQRVDLWIDFPSMTFSICRASKGSFISPAVVQESSNIMKQLMKRHPAPLTLPHKPHRKSQDGWWQEQNQGDRGKGGAWQMLWVQPMGAVMASVGKGILQSVFQGKPTSSSADKASWCQHSSREQRAPRTLCLLSVENAHIHFPFPSLGSGYQHAWTCFYSFLFAVMLWATFWWLMTHNRPSTTGLWNNGGRRKSGRKLE